MAKRKSSYSSLTIILITILVLFIVIYAKRNGWMSYTEGFNLGKSSSISFEEYSDNWSYWESSPSSEHEQYPALVSGMQRIVAFAVVNNDGSFASSYPLSPPSSSTQYAQAAPCNTSSDQGSCSGMGFGVGGWNNSLPTSVSGPNGLYEVISSEDTSLQGALISSILNSIEDYGYKKVVIDYEYYPSSASESGVSYNPQPSAYTNFLISLKKSLPNDITLAMTMSPLSINQQFYTIDSLIGVVDEFQLMCYDYAIGQSVATANAGITATETMISGLLSANPDLSKAILSVGVPLYGTEMTPTSTPTAKGIASGKIGVSIPSQPDVSDDELMLTFNSWTSPSDGYELIEVPMSGNKGKSYSDYFYYSASSSTMYSAFPPQAMTGFADMMKASFPQITSFFVWEAEQDFEGTMRKTFMQSF